MMEASTITYSSSGSLVEASKEYVIKLLTEEDGVCTIRRIRLFRIVDPTGKVSFDRLVRLVSSKIRYTHHIEDLRLSYLDVDEDCVVVDSADELVDAIDQFVEQRVLRLFVGEVTPAMRQAYLAHGGKNKSNNPNKKAVVNGDLEHVIERQIEQILERRFRLLEQKRRELAGSVGRSEDQGPPPLLPREFPPKQRGVSTGIGVIRDEPSPHHLSGARRPQQPSPSAGLKSPHIRHHSPAHSGLGWPGSPIRVDDAFSSDSKEDGYRPDDINPRNVTRIRLPWEATDGGNRTPLRKQTTPNSTDHNNNSSSSNNNRRSFEYPTGNFNSDDEYDLSDGNHINHRQKDSQSPNNPRQDSPGFPTPRTKRINIGQDPVQTLDTRFARDPPKSSPREGQQRANYRLSSQVDHHLRPSTNASSAYRDDDDDFHPDEDDYDEEEDLRDDDDDQDLDLTSELGDSVSPKHRTRFSRRTRGASDGMSYNQDWETNTVDSDADLSLLLSDADFLDHLRENRDDIARDRRNAESSRFASEEQRQDPSVDGRQSADQYPDPSVSEPSVAPPIPRSHPPQEPQQEQQSTIQSPSPTKAKTPTKTPNSATSTPTTSSSKPPSVPARSNFNNIPRPTPPSIKKNKLLGILYNGE